jgi:hypothetical protein
MYPFKAEEAEAGKGPGKGASRWGSMSRGRGEQALLGGRGEQAVVEAGGSHRSSRYSCSLDFILC